MIFNNIRDPNAKSVWLERKPINNLTPQNCYSNLQIYGTNYGTIFTKSVPPPTTKNFGVYQKVEMPSPVEPTSNVMRVLGEPHPFNSGYEPEDKNQNKNCSGYKNINFLC